MRILSDEDYYISLGFDPTTKYQQEYNNFLTEAHTAGTITNKEKEFLSVKNPKIPIYYILPKIQKNPLNPPCRAIISGINSLTRTLSKYIDTFLQKYFLNLDSYLKDSAALILQLNEINWQPSYKWATLDVAALYSNIPHHLGILSSTKYLSDNPKLPNTQKEFITKGI